MINLKRGKVEDILKRYNHCTEVLVDIGGKKHKAINYDFLTGEVRIADKVLLNTTAVDLNLGSGGYHFIVSIDGRDFSSKKTDGHIMKLRYTPLQFSTLSAEEQDSPYHHLFESFTSLKNMPVIIGELHSMLLPAIFNIKRVLPNIKLSYIMTDGGALPINFSRNVDYLKQNHLIEGTVTYGQAFGGDYETVNIYTALIAAYTLLKSDITVVTMGPGITGTGTKYGFSGMEQGPIIDAVNQLGGRPIFIPRISFSDPRHRHRGLSHHSITILKEIADTPVELVIPRLEEAKLKYIQNQIKESRIDKKHKIIYIKDTDKVLENIQHYGYPLTTMGRKLHEELEFFKTAGSAGYYAANLIR